MEPGEREQGRATVYMSVNPRSIFICFPQNFNEFFPDREDSQRVVVIYLLKPGRDFYELPAKGAGPVFSQDWSEGDGFDIPNQ